jgi:hypothetical protein
MLMTPARDNRSLVKKVAFLNQWRGAGDGYNRKRPEAIT